MSFARHRRGDASALIVAQTQADNEDNVYNWTSVEHQRMRADFSGYFSTVATSAKTTRGIDGLIAEIQKSAHHIAQALEWVVVSNAWLSVESKIEEIQAENESVIPGRRVKRVISFDEFSKIAKKEGVLRGIKTLLHYLAATGVVIWDNELFSDRIIVDQQWALDAIYIVFDRLTNISRLKQASGRFTAQDLSEWIWNEQGYSIEEQSLFLSFMLSCRVCFPYSKNNGRITYIAPNGLPSMESVAEVLALDWSADWPTKRTVLDYDLLHDGMLRGLMYEIASLGGENVTFWSNGFQFFDKRTEARLRLVQERSESWTGRLVITVQTHEDRIKSWVLANGQTHKFDPSLQLGAEILRIVSRQEAYYGIESKKSQFEFVAAPGTEASASARTVPEPQVDPDGARGFFVSYAWGDDTPDGKRREAVVEEFCVQASRKGIHINIDKAEIRPGDSIIAYMDRLSQGSRVYVFLSAKYLSSINCMHELVSSWNYSRGGWEQFAERVKIYVLPCAEIFTPEHRLRIKEAWQTKWTALKNKHEALDPLIMSKPGAPERLEIDRVGAIASCCYEVLTCISDHLLISNFEKFCENGLSEID
ncbi:MAG: COR domain-containing protein [Bradyrhizobium sp.]